MPEPVVSHSEAELRSHVERVLSAGYDLEREIGRGGMGIVYLARDKRLKRQVAVKLLPPELAFRSEIRSRFLREAETAAGLSHPNIVPIYSVDEREGLVYFVMGYVDGDNLAKRLNDRGPMDVNDVRRILCETADALAYAHSRGVVHRDIKPDNILLDAHSGRSMVTDFGIARAVQEGEARLTATGMAIGTPAYMSPEQASGDRDVDGRTDLYSLGIVGYQMLAGEPPFTANTPAALLVKHLTEAPAPIDSRRAGVPADLGRAVMMLLEKDPANRFPSAASFVTALETGNVPELPSASKQAPMALGGGYPQAGYQSQYPLAPRGRVSPERVSPQGALASDEPTAEEVKRWSAPMVGDFRRKLAPYLAVNAVILPVGIFGGPDLYGVTVLWSIYVAYKYAKLWSEGYDWRDVFKQSRDRMLADVVAEQVDDIKATFDPAKREALREKERRRPSRPLFGDDRPAQLAAPVPVGEGPHSETLRQAAADRDEIVRLVETMPRAERDQIAEVVPTARALFDKMQVLAVSLVELERMDAPSQLADVEREITDLEARANPLEAGSEERVRRLAQLKRLRRSLADAGRRRQANQERIEHCRLALQNMRYDVLRFRTGAQTHQNVTLLAERAMSLARDVDGMVAADDELSRARTSGRGPRL